MSLNREACLNYFRIVGFINDFEETAYIGVKCYVYRYLDTTVSAPLQRSGMSVTKHQRNIFKIPKIRLSSYQLVGILKGLVKNNEKTTNNKADSLKNP